MISSSNLSKGDSKELNDGQDTLLVDAQYRTVY